MDSRFNRPSKQCPFCGEYIRATAIKCRFCEEYVGEDNSYNSTTPCPFCGEKINSNSTRCNYCGEFLPQQQAESSIKGDYGNTIPGFNTSSAPVEEESLSYHQSQESYVGANSAGKKKCSFCGEETLLLEAISCPFCGSIYEGGSAGPSRQQPSYQQEPPRQQSYHQAPPGQQSYQEPSGQPSYQAPPGQQSYQEPSGQPSYQAPPGQQSYQEPSGQPSYQAPPGQQSYQEPSGQPSYQAPPGQQSYQEPPYQPPHSESEKQECLFCGEINSISNTYCKSCNEALQVDYSAEKPPKKSYKPSGSGVFAPRDSGGESPSRTFSPKNSGSFSPKNSGGAFNPRSSQGNPAATPEPYRTAKDEQPRSPARESLLPRNRGFSIPTRRMTRPSSGEQQSTVAPKKEEYVECPLCGEKNPASATHCILCSEDFSSVSQKKEEVKAEAKEPGKQVRKSVVTDDLLRECLLCGEKNPVTASKCRICNEIFETDRELEQFTPSAPAPPAEVQVKKEVPEPEPEEEGEKPSQEDKGKRKKSYWASTPQTPDLDMKTAPISADTPKKYTAPRTSKKETDAMEKTCPECKEVLPPSGKCPNCADRTEELEALIKKDPQKGGRSVAVMVSIIGVFIIIGLLVLIGKSFYPDARDMVISLISPEQSPTVVAEATPGPTEIAALPTEPAEPNDLLEPTEEPVAKPTEEPSEEPTAEPEKTPAPKATPDDSSPAVSYFTDIDDDFAKDYINALLKAGVFGRVTSDKFNPYEPIKRDEYVRWMVTANNTLFPEGDDNYIDLKKISENYFNDVDKDHPDFSYIQVLRDKEYIIDIKNNNFEPEQNITREQLMMIRASLEYNIKPKDIKDLKIDGTIANLKTFFRDPEGINKDYLIAFQKDMTFNFEIFFRSFGRTKKIYPKTEVTRSEAAASIGIILGKSILDYEKSK